MEQTQKIKLSICIPTYNFGNYIGATLECIANQIVPGVEAIVLDGASTDNTQDVVSRLQQNCSSIVYYRQNFKGGIDKDMAKVVSLARGEYCWLMSGDDLIRQGGLRRVLSEIESGNDIYLCNRTECDVNMVPFRDRYWLKKDVKDKAFDLCDRHDLEDYLRSALSIGSLFSYMSSIIFKKSRWDEVYDKEYAYGTCYGHVYTLFSFMHYGCCLKYIRDPLVLCRFGNDSFSEKGFVRRVSIDFDGYHKIADKLFGNDAAMKYLFKNVIKREYPLYRLLKIRALSGDDEWKEISGKLIDIGHRPAAVSVCGIIGRCRPVINKMVKFKQQARNVRSLLYVKKKTEKAAS